MAKPLIVQVVVWCRVPKHSTDHDKPLVLPNTFAIRSSDGDWWYLCTDQDAAEGVTSHAVNRYPSCTIEEVQIVQVPR